VTDRTATQMPRLSGSPTAACGIVCVSLVCKRGQHFG
jgi:hypothetical protein